MSDVMPEQQAVDLNDLAGDEPAGSDVLDAVDEQLSFTIQLNSLVNIR